ncbi:hypothetical protein ACJX0J_040814, partial [Zea mays]
MSLLSIHMTIYEDINIKSGITDNKLKKDIGVEIKGIGQTNKKHFRKKLWHF